MPYDVKKGMGCPVDKPYAVVKKGTSEKLGCHATPEAAGKQIAAVERSEREKASLEWSELMRAFREKTRPEFHVGYVRLSDAENSETEPTELVVEVATSDVTRAAGYKYVKESKHDGILFVYDTDVEHAFTCRNVEIPLDIYWFDADGNMIGSVTAEAHEKTPISLERPYRFVLEVPAGSVDIQDGRVLHSEYEKRENG